MVEKEDGAQADAYYNSRSLKSRLGAIVSQQSQLLASRTTLVAEVAKVTAKNGLHPNDPTIGVAGAFVRWKWNSGQMGNLGFTTDFVGRA